jgi:hypothetical protein
MRPLHAPSDLGARPAERHGGFVQDQPTDVCGQASGLQGTHPSEGMPRDVHGAIERVDDCGNIHPLALKRLGGVAALTAPPSGP